MQFIWVSKEKFEWWTTLRCKSAIPGYFLLGHGNKFPLNSPKKFEAKSGCDTIVTLLVIPGIIRCHPLDLLHIALSINVLFGPFWCSPDRPFEQLHLTIKYTPTCLQSFFYELLFRLWRVNSHCSTGSNLCLTLWHQSAFSFCRVFVFSHLWAGLV